MSNLDLTTISSGFSMSKINSNFELIEDKINDEMLKRVVDSEDDNSMSTNIDMNSNKIVNLEAATISSDAPNLGQVLDMNEITAANAEASKSYEESAQSAKDAASVSAQEASQSAQDAILDGASSIASFELAAKEVITSAVDSVLQSIDGIVTQGIDQDFGFIAQTVDTTIDNGGLD